MAGEILVACRVLVCWASVGMEAYPAPATSSCRAHWPAGTFWKEPETCSTPETNFATSRQGSDLCIANTSCLVLRQWDDLRGWQATTAGQPDALTAPSSSPNCVHHHKSPYSA